MKRLFCLFLICCLLPVSAAAADKPLYSAGARISGPVYSEMRRDSSQTGRINPGYPIEVYARIQGPGSYPCLRLLQSA